MCTVSWRRESRGYELFFNRDERHGRGAELPPASREAEGVRYVAPIDPDSGGTWLLVNEWGLTVGLLNDYDCPWQPSDAVGTASRGSLVLSLASARDVDEAGTLAQRQPLTRTRPFHLLLFDDRQEAQLHWAGETLVRRAKAETVPPVTSSSFATSAVIAARRAKFAALASVAPMPSGDELRVYHFHHDSEAGAYSVNMCRPDAATRSISRIVVEPAEIRFSYWPQRWPGAPRGAEPTELRLARRSRP
ncbi:MAG TPA: NRDE family protein [Candidatus Synoicihabitans sp.]|nr:NRDE family protein [Candidatus Synoicihabitans sp.]